MRTAQLAVPDDVRMTAGACLYTIRVDGHLGAYVLSAFPGLAAEYEATGTVLTGVLDQAALYGWLAQSSESGDQPLTLMASSFGRSRLAS